MTTTYDLGQIFPEVDTLEDSIGTVVNTGGTASISAILGDFGNWPLAKRTPRRKSVDLTFTANATTESKTCFTVTGSVKILGLFGVVTTVLGANHTAAHFRLNDGTNTPALTVATGTTLSAAGVGSLVYKEGTASQALNFLNSDQVRTDEQSAGSDAYSRFVVNAKNGATTTIEYRYTTTDAPTSGAATFFVEYIPLSATGDLV